MAFVVPAEIGHARYAQALLPALCSHFERVQIVACREKLFPSLAEDCWLLFCAGFGGRSSGIHLSSTEVFKESARPPRRSRFVSLAEWQRIGMRLRPFLLSEDALSLYERFLQDPGVSRLGALASTNIGYVSGANSFFHLRPSDLEKFDIPRSFTRVTIRKSEQLPHGRVDERVVQQWIQADDQVLLMDLKSASELPQSIRRYLDSDEGHEARASYKCRSRTPWYAVPDVKTPDAFMSVMAGDRPILVENAAGCSCTNSILALSLKPGTRFSAISSGWNSALAELGAEIEGHPLGGGMLKLEPREAAAIPIPGPSVRINPEEESILRAATKQARAWRHYD
jgi:hypothetical protein